MTVETYDLLGDLSEVPPEYIKGVAETKRFLERWTMDPSYQEEYAADPLAALAALGLSLSPEQVVPLIDADESRRISQALRAGEDPGCPDSVIHYRAFIAEKRNHRSETRVKGESSNATLAAWRTRQVRRCQSELGAQRSDAIVHAPMAIELSKGCTVGCWFCGVAAPKFDNSWPYTAENAELWRGSLQVLRDVIGPSAAEGFLYWATDPLDNLDYESYLTDFHELMGRCPQTTTANGPKDIDRTRKMLELTHSLDSTVDRFSIISLNHLYRLHDGLTAEQMLRVECVPQNKESSPRYLKSNAGRARKFNTKRAKELVKEEASSTIACVSGFLLNMIDRRVQMVTPCNATDEWPLGYWVVDEGYFNSPEELRDVLESMISGNARPSLGLSDVVRLRPDLTVVTGDESALAVTSQGMRTTFGRGHGFGELALLVKEGTRTVQEIGLECSHSSGIPLAQTFALLNEMFKAGVLDEEPTPPPAPSAERKSLPISVKV